MAQERNFFDQFDEQQTTPPSIPTRPADPFERPKAAADLVAAQARAQAAPFDTQKAQADAAKAAAEAEAARAKQAKLNSPLARLNELAKADNVIAKINEARALIRKGGTSGWGAYLSNLPETDALALSGAFDTIQANLAFDRLQQMRDQSPTGGAVGSVTERELALLGSTVASLNQKQDAETLLNNLDAIERHYQRFQAGLSGIDPNTKEGEDAIRKAFGATGKPPRGGEARISEGTPTVGIAERFSTDADKKFAKLAQAAFNRGASRKEMDALNAKYGYPPYGADLDKAIQDRARGRAVYLQAPVSGYNDPSIAERAFQSVAASPVGSFTGQAANALSLGLMDEITGVARGDTLREAWNGTGENTAEANLVKQLSADANPWSSVAGNLTGGALAALGTGGVTGAGRAATATFAPRLVAADALYGGLYGLGESNDGRLGGAVTGTLAGAGGGIFGRGLTRKVGQAVGGVGGPAQALRDLGVRLTPGQIGESSGGMLGRMLKRREDRLSGFSGIGDAIAQRQREGLEGFNRAAFREALEPINEVPPAIGEEGIDQGLNLISDYYGRTLRGRSFDVNDPQFVSDLGGALGAARELPAIGDQAAFSLRRSVEPFIDDAGQMTGRGFQQSRQELTRRATRFDNSPDAVGPDAASVLRQGADAVESMVRRQAPEVVDDLNSANTAYRRTQILQDAVGRAINNEGLVTPAQLGLAARENAKRFGGRYATPDRPFFELQRAGQQVLPSKVPDSGTAGRQASGDGFLGLARSAARNARLPIYSDPGISLVETLLLARPESARQIGGTIRNQARIGGVFGAPLALPYTVD